MAPRPIGTTRHCSRLRVGQGLHVARRGEQAAAYARGREFATPVRDPQTIRAHRAGREEQRRRFDEGNELIVLPILQLWTDLQPIE